ncbi:hypothetical protein L1049_017033 [Liquidambar formosana]|uniref:Uncharacterized protein n=1 Tax=Liquidambar formosana TaxID=63359 RepID=A0AAP0S7I1_LIQFO
MALAKVVERLLGPGNRDGGLLRDCFTSLMEASIRLKEVQDEKEEDEEAEENEDDEDDDDDDDDETEDNDEDSEDDEREETEEEFLDRYAKAAVALENDIVVEEGDVEDQDEEPELGFLEEVDPQRVVWSLIESHHQVLTQVQALPPQLISSFLNTFPEYQSLFQQSR